MAKCVPALEAVNDFVIKFANVNGTGSASANALFAKSVMRMGVPVVPKNIFPSNIQGLPTWYEVRISANCYLGRREGVDFMVSVNPQSIADDVTEVHAGGYFLYDSSKPLAKQLRRDDINYIGIPLSAICRAEYQDLRQQKLFKNVIYVGALAAIFDMELEVIHEALAKQFKGKEQHIQSNIKALQLGYDYACAHYSCPLGLRVQRIDAVGEQILLDGNTALGLGAIYGGATFASWYPITPSTSVVDAFTKYAKKLRVCQDSGKNNFAVVQAEDELAAVGMAIGANWNGARAFTATSGPGISLMSEFLGLAYFAELPLVLFNIQRVGPSTGMPTRTQQADFLSCAYASHGDTRQVLLFPSTPAECFEMAAESFDIADELQTPVIVMSDLDLGMNENLSPPLRWDDTRRYCRGKILREEDLNNLESRFGRYLDVDGDGICPRTLPGTHPSKGAFFTRGTSRDEYAIYTEKGEEYERNMRRLLVKWETAKKRVPAPLIENNGADWGLIWVGSSSAAVQEALVVLREDFKIDAMRIRAFPFSAEVDEFVAAHEQVFVIEQNRDAQLRSMLMIEGQWDSKKIESILHFDGTPITAQFIVAQFRERLASGARENSSLSATSKF